MGSGRLETLEPPRANLWGGLEESEQESVQPKPGPCQDFPEVVASAAEKSVHGVAHHTLEEVPAEQPVVLHVANLGFHGRPPAEVALESVTEPACAADEHPASFGGDPVALVAAVHEGDFRNLAGEAFDLVQLAVKGVAIVGIVRKGLDANDEALLLRNAFANTK